MFLKIARTIKIKFYSSVLNTNKGMALFLVTSTLTVLALLATEFIYVAQINQKMAYEAVDQIRAHYLAKSALKISILRLRIYQQIRSNEFVKKSGVPLDQIWSFPFIYPIPQLPGMTKSQMGEIDKFQKTSALEGDFSALIESESSKFNLNLLLPYFKPDFKKPEPKQNQNASPSTNNSDPNDPSAQGANPNSSTNPQASDPSFNVEESRKQFSDFLTLLFNQKKQTDEDFLDRYNNFDIQSLINNILAWVDYTYESPNFSNDQDITPKKAPLFDLSELHMIPLMDDELYKLFAPSLTAGVGLNINVNTMSLSMLRAFFPILTEEQSQKMITEREDPALKGRFKDEEDFYKTIQTHTGWDAKTLEDEKLKFKNRNINFVAEETNFKITIQSVSNLASQNLEATVSLVEEKSSKKSQTTNPDGNDGTNTTPPADAQNTPETPNAGFKKSKTGIKIDMIRFL